MRVLYFDLMCGAAGDMLLASLIDLGFPVERLLEQLEALPIEKIDLSVEKVPRSGITCTQLTPLLGHAHEHRHLVDILSILRGGNLSPQIIGRCERVLDRLADAEATVHGIPKEKVHFHEIGALDTIVDIVGFCMAIEYFCVDEIHFSTLTDGYGTIRTAHGTMPVPVPATAVMIEGFACKSLPIATELLTPTGAALLTTLGTQVKDQYAGTVVAMGYGCGSKVFDEHPNFLRAVLLDTDSGTKTVRDAVVVLESDMDHISGEIMGDVADRLREAGAKDVCWIPVFMKKGRPGYRLSVITTEEKGQLLTDIIIRHTRTLGVRVQRVDRVIALRNAAETEISGAACTIKECSYGDYRFSKPEYESLAALAREQGTSVLDLFEEFIRRQK